MIPGYTRYMVDREGKVYGRYGYEVKPRIRPSGQASVDLYSDDGKRNSVAVARCLALGFLGPSLGREAMHHDGNIRNDNLENVRWGTRLDIAAGMRERGRLNGGRKRKADMALAETGVEVSPDQQASES